MKLLKPSNIQKVVKFMNTPRAGKYIPYGWGSRKILKFLESDYAQKKHFRGRMNLFKEFLTNLDNPPPAESFLPDLLVSSFLKPWRAAAISHINAKQFKKYVRVHGLEKLDESYKKGKGVIILSSHWGLAEAAMPVFPMLGYTDFHTVVRKKGTESIKISGLKKNMQPKLIIFNDHSNAELFKSLYKAREVLQNGGIFHILGDGYHGKSSVNMNFLGRIRGFRGSFAELALSTEARVHTIFVSIENDGSLDIYIYDPIDMGDENTDRQERIEYMVKQYACHLEDRWKREPQHINWGFMEKYLRQVRQSLS